MYGVYVQFFFFFQAEDGIRDLYVTGVQTCALPIFLVDGGDCELEGRPFAVAGGNPDPAAERSLDDQAAEVQPKAQAALRAVAARGPRLLEQVREAPRGQARPAVGDRDLEPSVRDRARPHLHLP